LHICVASRSEQSPICSRTGASGSVLGEQPLHRVASMPLASSAIELEHRCAAGRYFAEQNVAFTMQRSLP